jgi:acyl transferase domain-containing protein
VAEVDDPDIVEATMAKPGIVLKRPAGLNKAFSESADILKQLARGKKMKSAVKPKRARAKVDAKAASKAALAFEKEKRWRAREQQRRRPLGKAVGTKLRAKGPNGTTRRSERTSSRPNARLSRREHKPKTTVGISRQRNWRTRSVVRDHEEERPGEPGPRRGTFAFAVFLFTETALSMQGGTTWFLWRPAGMPGPLRLWHRRQD